MILVMFPACCTGTGRWEVLLSRSGTVIGQRGKAAASAVVKVCWETARQETVHPASFLRIL